MGETGKKPGWVLSQPLHQQANPVLPGWQPHKARIPAVSRKRLKRSNLPNAGKEEGRKGKGSTGMGFQGSGDTPAFFPGPTCCRPQQTGGWNSPTSQQEAEQIEAALSQLSLGTHPKWRVPGVPCSIWGPSAPPSDPSSSLPSWSG